MRRSLAIPSSARDRVEYAIRLRGPGEMGLAKSGIGLVDLLSHATLGPMPIDESFLKKEAARRRIFTILILVLLANVVVLGVMYMSGFLHREPTVARVIIYSELVIFGALYLFLRAKYLKKRPK